MNVKNLVSFGKKRLGLDSKKQPPSKEVVASVYNKVNFYLTKMSLNYEYSTDLFISIAKEYV